MSLKNKYVSVLVDVPNLGTRTFSYLISEDLRADLALGQALLVPFGKKRLIKAFAVGFSDYLPEGINAKEIIKILDKNPLFDINYLKLLEWVSNYYCCDLLKVLQSAIPMKFLAVDKSKTEKHILFKSKIGASARQLEILDLLEKTGQCPLIDFEKSAKTTRNTINKLAELGCVEICEVNTDRNPLDIFNLGDIENAPKLNEEQNEAYKKIEEKIDNFQSEPILLHGITASGKTEVYFKAIEHVIKKGKNVLFLAPEIALASQLTKRLAKRFGTKDVALWHSSISEGEKYDVWNKLRNNEIKILAGARSAVFAPLKNIGLIIIDEEHESAYKQTTPAPRYDARIVAQKLSSSNNASVIIGSATPDVNSYYRAVNTGNLIELKKRFNDAPLAKVITIDMREEFNKENKTFFSRILIDEIRKNLLDKKQTMLLINRRGFSTTTQCLACGEVIQCDKCAIPMIWHKNDNTLKCHWCNAQKIMPKTCPKCGSDAIKNSGLGTQKVEQIVEKLFPTAKVARLDSDVLTRKTTHIDILDDFSNGKIDILIGTQMIAKGLDNENVTIVGAVSADSSFNFPDYRSSERGFQLLTQIAGRAGRGKYQGKVYFQSYNPDFYAIENAKSQDYKTFYESEIVAREEFYYPPFSQILRIIISSKNNFRAEKSIQEIALRLKTLIEKQAISEHLIVLGPSPCLLERIRDEYRFQILIKNKLDEKGHFFITSFLKKIILPQDIKMVVDIDPVDIV